MKLSVALLLLATACFSSSSSPKAPAEKSGRAERLQIGNLEAYALADGHLVVPNDGQLLGFYIGDLAHHSVISVQRPAWSIQVDADRPAAEAMRQQTLAKLAADRTRVFAVHFPLPGVGHVVAEGQGLVWRPEAR